MFFSTTCPLFIQCFGGIKWFLIVCWFFPSFNREGQWFSWAEAIAAFNALGHSCLVQSTVSLWNLSCGSRLFLCCYKIFPSPRTLNKSMQAVPAHLWKAREQLYNPERAQVWVQQLWVNVSAMRLCKDFREKGSRSLRWWMWRVSLPGRRVLTYQFYLEGGKNCSRPSWNIFIPKKELPNFISCIVLSLFITLSYLKFWHFWERTTLMILSEVGTRP